MPDSNNKKSDLKDVPPQSEEALVTPQEASESLLEAQDGSHSHELDQEEKTIPENHPLKTKHKQPSEMKSKSQKTAKTKGAGLMLGALAASGIGGAVGTYYMQDYLGTQSADLYPRIKEEVLEELVRQTPTKTEFDTIAQVVEEMKQAQQDAIPQGVSLEQLQAQLEAPLADFREELLADTTLQIGEVETLLQQVAQSGLDFDEQVIPALYATKEELAAALGEQELFKKSVDERFVAISQALDLLHNRSQTAPRAFDATHDPESEAQSNVQKTESQALIQQTQDLKASLSQNLEEQQQLVSQLQSLESKITSLQTTRGAQGKELETLESRQKEIEKQQGILQQAQGVQVAETQALLRGERKLKLEEALRQSSSFESELRLLLESLQAEQIAAIPQDIRASLRQQSIVTLESNDQILLQLYQLSQFLEERARRDQREDSRLGRIVNFVDEQASRYITVVPTQDRLEQASQQAETGKGSRAQQLLAQARQAVTQNTLTAALPLLSSSEVKEALQNTPYSQEYTILLRAVGDRAERQNLIKHVQNLEF